MGKQLTIKDANTDKTYTLEFNRRSIQVAESRGLDVSELESKPATMLPLLIQSAFYMHHKGITPDTVDKIYATVPNREEFIEALAEMYAEPLEALLADPKSGKSKNASWTKSW